MTKDGSAQTTKPRQTQISAKEKLKTDINNLRCNCHSFHRTYELPKAKKGGSVIMKLEIEMVRLSTVAVVVKGASCEHTLHGHLRHRKARSILDYATLFTFQAFSRGVCIHSYI